MKNLYSNMLRIEVIDINKAEHFLISNYLALMQHHGAATRLLDFSRNALIALWFCLNENSNKNALLLGISSNSLGGYEGGEYLIQDYDEQTKDLDKYELLPNVGTSYCDS